MTACFVSYSRAGSSCISWGMRCGLNSGPVAPGGTSPRPRPCFRQMMEDASPELTCPLTTNHCWPRHPHPPFSHRSHPRPPLMALMLVTQSANPLRHLPPPLRRQKVVCVSAPPGCTLQYFQDPRIIDQENAKLNLQEGQTGPFRVGVRFMN